MPEETLFIEALDIPDPAGRARFLDCACAGDVTLRRRLEKLFARHERAGDFLARPAAALEAGHAPGQEHRPGVGGANGIPMRRAVSRDGLAGQ
jgi:hypothetical protein